MVGILILGCAEADKKKSQESQIRESPFGVCQLYLNDDNAPIRDLMIKANVKWARVDFLMEFISPQEDVFDFEVYDLVVQEAETDNINLLALLVYEIPWSSGGESPHTDQQITDYVKVVKKIVGRYKDKIKYWEIWNEPDLPEYWKPEPNAEDYAIFIKKVFNAIKEVDSGAKVIGLGGIDPGKTDFIEQIFSYDSLDYMDSISIHPYSHRIPFEKSSQYQSIPVLKELMKEYGKEKPLWVTEIGYTTAGDNGVSEELKSIMLHRSQLILLSEDTERIFWYTVVDGDVPLPDYGEGSFGLLKKDITPKNSYHSYKVIASLLEKSKFIKSYDVGENNRALLFDDKNGEKILAAWTIDEVLIDGEISSVNNKNLNLKIDGKIRQITDIFGLELEITISNDKLNLTITNSPVYIIGDFDVKNIMIAN
jgi:hypothetical protein